MKANELMIDDWVYNKNIDKPMQVYPMMFSQMFRQRPDATTEDYNIFPIPLTPEILEKNGFNGKYKRSYQYNMSEEDFAFTHISYWKGRLSIRVSPDIREKHLTNVMHINCDYVHQLQHSLKLCGIEKEIEL